MLTRSRPRILARFIKISSKSTSNLRVGILSGLTTKSDEDLCKKITTSVRIPNAMLLSSFDQDYMQNFLRRCVSRLCKRMSVLIRILMRKYKDLVKIFAGYLLVYSAVFAIRESLEGSFRIINLNDPVEFAGSFQDLFSILFRFLTRIIEWFSSKFY
jgi:hypothetical protein